MKEAWNRVGVDRVEMGDGLLQTYQKPVEDFYAVSSKKGSKNASKQRSGGAEGQAGVKDRGPSVVSGVASFIKSGVVKTKASASKAKKGGKSVSLSEAADGSVVFRGGEPCNCQASRHRLVNNCLACGKIVCEQEGEGPCNFCGALVLREGSQYAGLEGVVSVPSSDSEAAAIKFKNRLVEYGRNSASRTAVIDDQTDYYQMEGNSWLTPKEKKELRKRQEEAERIDEERRKRVVVTVDLLGRKVVLADDDGKENGVREVSILTGEVTKNDHRSTSRIKPNPSLRDRPTFLDASQQQKQIKNGQQVLATVDTGRVQHEDPFLSTLINLHQTDTNVKVVEGSWWNQSRNGVDYSSKSPKVSERVFVEDDECAVDSSSGGNALVPDDMHNSNLDAAGGRPLAFNNRSSPDNSFVPSVAFDICVPLMEDTDRKGKPLKLAPSLLSQKQAERKESLGKTIAQEESVHHLSPGIAFLRSWLTIGEQAEIIIACRKLGLGPGGFYKPSYGGGRSMKVQMMCLGKHWEPRTQTYEEKRMYHDNAEPPRIPDIFSKLVEKALVAAQAKTEGDGVKKNKSKAKAHTILNMKPNICIVNFYEQGGTLGMHQDHAESPESLRKGSPVVSFSLGDSAEFCFGKERNVQNAEKVILESGDVFIFGGPARMIYHGVTRVHPRTAPAALIEKTNLRPGRLNLTFREY